MLERKLTLEEKRELLETLFSFYVDSEGTIYDENNDEFFGYNTNDTFNFDTLDGIFAYHGYISQEHGKRIAIEKIKQALGID